MYYVKQIRNDSETKKSVTIDLLSTKDKSIAFGVWRQFANTCVQYCKPPCFISDRIYDGNTVIARFDCYLSDEFSNK